jgi:hypothetical protein
MLHINTPAANAELAANADLRCRGKRPAPGMREPSRVLVLAGVGKGEPGWVTDGMVRFAIAPLTFPATIDVRNRGGAFDVATVYAH